VVPAVAVVEIQVVAVRVIRQAHLHPKEITVDHLVLVLAAVAVVALVL
jgi:hypothetical protein